MVCDKNAWCHNSEWLVGHFICSKSLLSIEWLSFPIIFAILCRVKFSINIPISSMHTQTYIYIQCHTYIGKFDKQTIPAKVQIHQIMKLKRQNQINNNNSIRFDINEQNGEWLEFVDCTVANNDRSIVCYLFKMCVCECVCVCARGYFCAECQPASQLNRPLTYSSDWKSNYLNVSNGIQYIFGMEKRKGNTFLNSANNKYMGAFSEIQFYIFFSLSRTIG